MSNILFVRTSVGINSTLFEVILSMGSVAAVTVETHPVPWVVLCVLPDKMRVTITESELLGLTCKDAINLIQHRANKLATKVTSN